jgi:hypothetical protein
MSNAIAPLDFDFPAPLEDAKAFDAWTGGDLAQRTLARMEARGLEVTWAAGDTCWNDRRGEKVGCFTGRGVFFHTEWTAHLDLQGFDAKGTEVIVRVRLSRLGRDGKVTSEVLVGAFVGGGLDACGRMVEPRFLHDSRNAPEVKAARAALGLK